MVSPATRLFAAQAVVETGRSKNSACRALGVPRSALYVKRGKQCVDKEYVIEMEIVKLSEAHPRYGYRRVRALLARAGHRVNAKRVQRMRRQAGLLVPRKRRKMRRLGPSQEVRRQAGRPGEVWSWDFIGDQTEDGRQLRILNLLDEYTRLSLAIHVDRSIRAEQVIAVVEAAVQRYGAPAYIRSDNGPEFIAEASRKWLVSNGIGTIYITPGSPWENAYIETRLSG
jgi:putative transposase